MKSQYPTLHFQHRSTAQNCLFGGQFGAPDLYGLRSPAGDCRITSRWRLSLYERIKVLFTGDIYLQQYPFDKPPQTVKLQVKSFGPWEV